MLLCEAWPRSCRATPGRAVHFGQGSVLVRPLRTHTRHNLTLPGNNHQAMV